MPIIAVRTPAISNAVYLRNWDGLTFNTEDTGAAAANASAVAAAQLYAYENGKYIDAAFGDKGYLAISSAVNITTSWYGGYGPMAEIRYVGDQNCCVITGANVTIQNVRFNRQKYRHYRLSALTRDGSGNITATFPDGHPYEEGDFVWLQSIGESLTGWARDTSTAIATATADTIVIPGGTASVATYDLTRDVALTAAVREGGYLIFTTAATHYFYPGQKIRVNGHIKTGAIVGATSPQNLNLSTANVDSSGTRGYIDGVTVTNLAKGHSVYTDTGEIQAGTIINDFDGTRIYLNKLITGTRVGASVIFSHRTMDATDVRVERIYSTTKFAVIDGGRDDTAVDVNSATVSLHGTQGDFDRVPCVRMSQVNAGSDSTKALIVNARGATLRDVEVLGTSLYTYAPDFTYERVACLDTAWDTFGILSNARRGKLLHCRSGLTSDDGMVILAYDKFGTYPGEIYVLDHKAQNNTKGHAFKITGGSRVLVDSLLSEYSQCGFSVLYDQATYLSGPSNDIHVRSATLRGCGAVDPVNAYAAYIPQGSNLRIDNMEVIDSNNGAFGTTGAGIKKGGTLTVSWTRALGAWTVGTGNTPGKEVDIDTFDIKETYATAIQETDGNRGSSFRIGRLLMEDINRSEVATGYGLYVGSAETFRGRIEIGEWAWTKQRYVNTAVNTTPAAPATATTMISVERSRFPWDMSRIGALLTQRAGWVPIAKWNGDLDDGSGATGDKAMTILPAVHGYRSIVPAGLIVRANDAAATCTGYGNITVRDAISGGGNLLVAGGKTWLSLNGSNPARNLSEQLMAWGILTDESPTVQFSFEGGAQSQTRPTRMDEVMPGMDVTGNGVPDNTYVTAVNRAAQTITLSANATSTTGSELTFTGAIPQNVTLDIAVDGSTPTIYLVVTGLLTGSNLDDCDVYLLGRMGY